MDHSNVQKEIGLFLEHSHLDTSTFEDDKDRLAYARTIAELYKTHLDDRKLDLELNKFEFEKELEEKKLVLEGKKIKSEKAGKITETVVRVFCTIAEVGVPASVYLLCYDKGMQFEKDGVVTSGFFKNMLHLIRPTKK